MLEESRGLKVRQSHRGVTPDGAGGRGKNGKEVWPLRGESKEVQDNVAAARKHGRDVGAYCTPPGALPPRRDLCLVCLVPGETAGSLEKPSQLTRVITRTGGFPHQEVSAPVIFATEPIPE